MHYRRPFIVVTLVVLLVLLAVYGAGWTWDERVLHHF